MPVSGWEAERERLRKALASLGFGTEEKIGWRGAHPAPSTDAHFRCEFCHAENLNCDEIAHTDECPVTICRAALSESKEQTTAEPVKSARQLAAEAREDADREFDEDLMPGGFN